MTHPKFPHTADDQTLKARFRPVFTRIAEGAVQREIHRTLAYEEINALRDLGFGTLRVPVELGGLGASVHQLFELLIELGAADSNLSQALRPHWAFVEDQRLSDSESSRNWLRIVAGGKLVGNAVTEAGHGAVERYQTALTNTPDGLRLNGTKFYSTGSLYADYIAIHADRDGKRVTVLVDADAPGISQSDDWDGFGQRLTASGTVNSVDVAVSEDRIIGPGYGTAGRTWSTAYLQLILLASLAGIARRAEQDAITWVRPRTRTFSHAPADLPREDPLVQATIGQLSAAAFGARAAVLAVADALDALLDAGATDPEQLDEVERSIAKAQSVVIGLVLDATTRLFEVGGASIASGQYALDRHWRNARTLASHNPLSYKHRSLGDNLLNGTPLPYQWSAGVRKRAQA
ncbi:hypothetical protein AGMMS49543_26230 [Betaproteobacteria bacterium]|nr:hypothetical protein AGMMS49543_26230 [Betaproteobacteria bacterium]GHU21153.1 hypothetical protein AGMMS50243_18110 [Betaproteobacteria bacterium]